MINSLDMKQVSRISYNADTLREVFDFEIIYRDGRKEKKEIPLYVIDVQTNKKIINEEAANIANFVTESSKKVNAVKKPEESKAKNEEVNPEVEKIISYLVETGAWIKLEDLKEFLPLSAYKILYTAYSDKIIKTLKNQGYSEEQIEVIKNNDLQDAKFQFTLDKDGRKILREATMGPKMVVAINLSSLKLDTLLPVAERVMTNYKINTPEYNHKPSTDVLEQYIEYTRNMLGKQKEVPKVEETKEKRVASINHPFSERKLETLNNILKAKAKLELSSSELEAELKKLSREYDVSNKSMDVLYQKAKLELEKENAIKIARKKLAGRKMPSKFQARNNKKLELTTPSVYNKAGYISRSKDLVIPELQEDWIKYINDNYRDPVHIYGAVDVMVMINNGTNIREIHKYLDKLHYSNSNAKRAIELLGKYSPYGIEIGKKCRKYMMSRPERLKQFVLDKSSFFIEKVDEKEPLEAIEELKRLREDIKELSMVELTTLKEEESKKMR